MISDLMDLPRYSTADYQLDAALFNRVKVALLRLGSPIRFPLPRLRHLNMVLDHETWIVVDDTLNDMPVMAWVEFQTEHREALHTPIGCKLYAYHCHAEVIEGQVLESIADELAQRLEPDHLDELPLL